MKIRNQLNDRIGIVIRSTPDEWLVYCRDKQRTEWWTKQWCSEIEQQPENSGVDSCSSVS